MQIKLLLFFSLPLIFILSIAGCESSKRQTDSSNDNLARVENNAIIFYGHGQHMIQSIKPDGTGLDTLIESDQWLMYPRWSPDRKKLVFFGKINTDGFNLFTVNHDGSDTIQLTNLKSKPGCNFYFPAWSPDGSSIAFNYGEIDGFTNIYITNTDGSGTFQLTSDVYSDSWPAWSPDGNKIAYVSKRSNDYNLCVMNPDGTNQVELLDVNNSFIPCWSPDGSKIALILKKGKVRDIYVVNADGSNLRNITNSLEREFLLPWAWSPDGEHIAYTSSPGSKPGLFIIGGKELSIINVNNLKKRCLTCEDTIEYIYDLWYSWSPDGQSLVYTCEMERLYFKADLFSINIDGTSYKRLTETGKAMYPAWAQ